MAFAQPKFEQPQEEPKQPETSLPRAEERTDGLDSNKILKEIATELDQIYKDYEANKEIETASVETINTQAQKFQTALTTMQHQLNARIKTYELELTLPVTSEGTKKNNEKKQALLKQMRPMSTELLIITSDLDDVLIESDLVKKDNLFDKFTARLKKFEKEHTATQEVERYYTKKDT
ncbi:hypothetical protein COT97_01865 [Candidatus Falkowbacteria bacterium CG10_big_fil_rev_8_21_14_0_10_39_11]|uniref:Uncharacterized protein n=1 Tax=Candidatus Falkowbacteria bacterium CG10_big_fil_rev_8_21_14_0_10_39_11 TaxID=1974565 RepID=A0A2H0V7G9_9BACT|nr:MAG: hypothetical protein COT97_01865 [Candidatus Falkowbacteria bacterium CG10_big_fil_rev_8_21_14_0_10_39_11]